MYDSRGCHLLQCKMDKLLLIINGVCLSTAHSGQFNGHTLVFNYLQHGGRYTFSDLHASKIQPGKYLPLNEPVYPRYIPDPSFHSTA